MNYYQLTEQLFNQLQYMICKLYGCDKSAAYPWPYCSMTHGVDFKQDAKDYEDYKNGEKLSNWYSSDPKGLPNWPIEKMEHMYAKCN